MKKLHHIIMSCCDDPNTRKEKPFPAILSMIAVVVLIFGGAILLFV